MAKQSYTTGEAAKMLGLSTKTLQRWDASKKLVAGRTNSGRRFYTAEQLESLFPSKDTPEEKQDSPVLDITPAGDDYVVTIKKDGFTGKVDVDTDTVKEFADKLRSIV